ncbi:MAG TPA: amidohydrolase family protein [Sphingomicrobium sp.]|jgi:imidazolonepropionase-like amidohydrolase|nr:amidohydrolase family protein [Sphingomicrobium sp.]
MKSPFLSLLFGVLLMGNAPFEPPQGGSRTIYRHASLIDGTGSAIRSDMAVITSGERIVAVIPDSSLQESQLENARLVDLSGKFLLPGYIDSHQHLATPPNRPEAEARLKRDIYSGITATRDMADDLRQMADVTRAARVGEIPSPDIDYAALMAGPSFFDDPRTQAIAQGAKAGQVPWEQAIDHSTGMPLAVARAKGTYATAVKIYANLPGDLVARITIEAHRQKMKVWAHGMVFPATPFEVVDAGVDTVSHTCYLAYQPMAKRPDSYQHRFPIDPALFDHDNPVMAKLYTDMRQRGTILDATLHVYREVEAAAREQHKPPLCTVALAGKLTNQAYRAGVQISTGTDGDTPSSESWPSLFDEFELLHDAAGLPPMAVIKAATITGAKAMGEEAEMGTITPGKLANMVILSLNPLEDVRHMRSVVMTVKRGRDFPRSDYRP